MELGMELGMKTAAASQWDIVAVLKTLRLLQAMPLAAVALTPPQLPPERESASQEPLGASPVVALSGGAGAFRCSG